MQPSNAALAETWDLPPDAAGRCDPLLACLVQITGLYGKPWSVDSLTAGLPIPDTGLTPALFVRAANQAGFSARIVRRDLVDVPHSVLPAVLLLKRRRACVLTKSAGDDAFELLQPESGGTTTIRSDELQADYSGYTIFVQPRPRLDARSVHAVIPRPRHWFWSEIARSWPIYGEALLASLLINLFALVTPFFTMNIYDRVVPNLALSSLWVLTIGALLVFAFDLLMRTLRAHFIDVAGKRVDLTLSANIFANVLGIRMANRPASVGAFANNVQEFESFRDFVTSATITTLVDLPFALLFVLAMAWIGGPIAWIPVVAFPLIVGIALALQAPLARVVQQSFRHASERQAALVESLAGLETVKTQGAEGAAQRRWEQAIGEIARLGLRSRALSSLAVSLNVADSPMARVRMSAMTLCYLIQHQVGIETILHFTTRDRSLMGLQSELLGAHAVGVRNIIALTGDPPSLGDYPESSAVYDVDSIGLIRVIGRLNSGCDSAGASIGRMASFTIACAVDPTRADLEEEARRLRAKLAAGAHLVMTQPIYDLGVWLRFLEVFAEPIEVPILLGILPLQSHKHAEFLHNEVPGITLTDRARERMRLAGADGRREGVKMAQELLAAARPHVQGVYIMPSFGRYEVAAEVLEVLGATV